MGANESAFRAVNERIENISERHDLAAEFVCECSDLECAERLSVPLDDYERVRAHGDRFIVTPGHERPDVELVVEEGRGWIVVEKIGEAGEVAEEEDPRNS
jgi:hypothetical protein